MKAYVDDVYKALQSQILPYADLIPKIGIEATRKKAYADHGINHLIGPVLKSLYKDAARMAEDALHINKVAPGSMGINIGFVQDVIAYFNQFLFDKIVLPITVTTQQTIRDALDKAVLNGWGITETIQYMGGMDITKSRSRTIVRTESIRAMNYSQLRAADDADFEVQKEWLSVHDERTRNAHVNLDGQIRDLADDFDSDLGPLLFPGDPSAEAANVINCRCTLGYTYKRDKNGDLIPKQPVGNENISSLFG